jgi:hypothetical protein
MRFKPTQTLFAVHFGYSNRIPRTYGFFSSPMMFDDSIPDDINFTKLTVTEHHKVPSEYGPADDLCCDGYLLKDEAGKVFANQYPHASYGQISDEGDRRFGVYTTEEGSLSAMRDADPKTVFEYHLLSDVAEKIYKGIKELREVLPESENYNRCKSRAILLERFIDTMFEKFAEQYPDYKTSVRWMPYFKDVPDMLRIDVSFYMRVSPYKAKTMSKEDIVKAINNDGIFEVEFSEGSRLTIEHASGTYSINGASTLVKSINVLFAEKIVEEGGKIAFNVHQTEYFPPDWVDVATDCFIARLQGYSHLSANTGMSLEAIAARAKKTPESLQQTFS